MVVGRVHKATHGHSTRNMGAVASCQRDGGHCADDRQLLSTWSQEQVAAWLATVITPGSLTTGAAAQLPQQIDGARLMTISERSFLSVLEHLGISGRQAADIWQQLCVLRQVNEAVNAAVAVQLSLHDCMEMQQAAQASQASTSHGCDDSMSSAAAAAVALQQQEFERAAASYVSWASAATFSADAALAATLAESLDRMRQQEQNDHALAARLAGVCISARGTASASPASTCSTSRTADMRGSSSGGAGSSSGSAGAGRGSSGVLQSMAQLPAGYLTVVRVARFGCGSSVIVSQYSKRTDVKGKAAAAGCILQPDSYKRAET